jgi:uncharacterized membrane protein YesL
MSSCTCNCNFDNMNKIQSWIIMLILHLPLCVTDFIYSRKNENCIINNNSNFISIKYWLIASGIIELFYILLSFYIINYTVFMFYMGNNNIYIILRYIVYICKCIFIIIGFVLIYHFNTDCNYEKNTKDYLEISIILKTIISIFIFIV